MSEMPLLHRLPGVMLVDHFSGDGNLTANVINAPHLKMKSNLLLDIADSRQRNVDPKMPN
jgi:hypothetical protein